MKCLVSKLVVASIVLAGHANAERFVINGGLGQADVNSGFEDTHYGDLAFGVKDHGLVYRLGVISLGEIERQHNTNASLDVNGVVFSIGKRVDTKRVAFELSGGAFFSKTRANFYGREIANESDTSPFINATFLIPIVDFFALEADWKYIDDASGGNYNLTRLGVRFSF